MPRGYRGFCIAFAGLILLGANSPSQNRSGYPAPAYTDQESRNHEKIAAGISRISDALEAQKSSSDPYEEERNKREIRDLQAQENSAYWAAAMFWATLFAILMSIIGIGLVWTTFRETRKANEIAKEANRPWLDVKLKLHGIAKTENAFSFRIELIVDNMGATPANHLRYAVDGVFLNDLNTVPLSDFEKRKNERMRAIGAAASRAEATIKAANLDGLTIFPKAIEPLFLEEHIASSSVDSGENRVAWFVVRLKYSLGHRDGNTTRVFIVRSFGLPNETGFDTIGEWGHSYTDTDARIDVWEEGGYAD